MRSFFSRYIPPFKTDPAWSKLLIFCLIFFFIRLSDSIIAFWATNQIESSLKNPVIMGAIISLQSVVGFAAGLVFSKILKNIHILYGGAVWTEKLSAENPWGVWLLPLYLLPSICIGIPLSGWHIRNGKKSWRKSSWQSRGYFLWE